MALVTAITCTGHRPEALALCEAMIHAQTYSGAIQWIVVDDSLDSDQSRVRTPKVTKDIFKGPTKWTEGVNTQRDNMNRALKAVRGDYVFIIEDEDLYRPDYIERGVKLLQECNVTGEVAAKYYHLGLPGYKELRNYQHAALCQTALKANVLPYLQRAVDSGELYFDIHFWRAVREQQIPAIMIANTNSVIGIKGMPGRIGIGEGHKVRDYILDPNLVKLKEWCGPKWDQYLPYIKVRNGNERKVLPIRTERSGLKNTNPTIDKL